MNILVDIDGTLASVRTGPGIGPPQGPVLELLYKLKEQGYELSIYSARFSGHRDPLHVMAEVDDWINEHSLRDLFPTTDVRNKKDYATRLIIDDIAIGVDHLGFPCPECMKRKGLTE